MAPRRTLSAAVTLFFVAPFVAEYLLGDLPLKLLPVLIVLAPAYGGGAVLIRDYARRTARGWPTTFLLGAAYSLIAEGLVTQSLFNPDYLKLHLHLLAPAYIPALGIGAWWSLFMVNLHMFWSMGVSIALVEALYPAQSRDPWLGRAGDAVVALLFVLGSLANFGIGLKQNRFVASHAQLSSIAVLSVVVILFACLLPAKPLPKQTSSVPSAWLTGAAALLLGLGVLYTPPVWGWRAVASLLALDAIFFASLSWLSRRHSWSSLHSLSLAGGGALAYGIHAFLGKPLVPGGQLWILIGHIVFLAIAVALVALGATRISRLTLTPPEATLEP